MLNYLKEEEARDSMKRNEKIEEYLRERLEARISQRSSRVQSRSRERERIIEKAKKVKKELKEEKQQLKKKVIETKKKIDENYHKKLQSSKKSIDLGSKSFSIRSSIPSRPMTGAPNSPTSREVQGPLIDSPGQDKTNSLLLGSEQSSMIKKTKKKPSATHQRKVSENLSSPLRIEAALETRSTLNSSPMLANYYILNKNLRGTNSSTPAIASRRGTDPSNIFILNRADSCIEFEPLESKIHLRITQEEESVDYPEDEESFFKMMLGEVSHARNVSASALVKILEDDIKVST